MADNELLQKLQRQQQKIVDANGTDANSEPCALDNGHHQNGHHTDNLTTSLTASQTNGLTTSTGSLSSNHSARSNNTVESGASEELMNRLARRNDINQGKPVDAPYVKGKSIYAEFSEFTRKQIKFFQEMFEKYDVNRDGFLCFEELKLMMEKLGAPQTHLALKGMIREVDEDNDNMISLREFLLIFRKAAAGELVLESGLAELCRLSEIDVSVEGVHGAKDFFEAKIDLLNRDDSFAAEIRREQEERRIEEETKRQRRAEFLAKQKAFNV